MVSNYMALLLGSCITAFLSYPYINWRKKRDGTSGNIIYELYLQLLKFLQKLAPIRWINNTFK